MISNAILLLIISFSIISVLSVNLFKSTAILFGSYDIQIISLLQALAVGLFGWALYREGLLWPFGLLALVIIALDFIYQWYKTKDKKTGMCFWAFRHNRWVGMILFLGIFLSLL